ncbi:MAG: hypothetical protein HF300_03045 [Ignavibacteria bacterium]|jgi:hypothetical protein|nr:hypothetical protein [Ignavibacteria bacterium]MCU7499751.1 hypothetical protein [Ignavibacteria bacterium]MCU7511505.1 hypothetical protein [Ignavibacteria bacterium]MCU7519502.1 hypothetical protein [Ignavibacteria bacterium]
MKFRISLITFLFISAVSGPLLAQGGQTTLPFLLMPTSAEMYGMGYASVALPSSDPMIPFYNPAQLGMQSFNNNLSVGYNSIDWLPSYRMGLKLTSFAINGGIDLERYLKEIPPVSIGFGYSNMKMNFGNFLYGDDGLGSSGSYDKTDNFTLSAAINYYIKASLGFTYKHVFSKLGGKIKINGELKEASATADLYDWGVFIQAPVFPILEKTMNRPFKIYQNISPVFDLTFGFSNSNLGQNSLFYISKDQADPLPRMARTGIGLLAGFKYEAGDVSIMPLTAKWTIEANDVLVSSKKAGGWDYQSGFGDINFFKEVIAGKTNFQTKKLKGWELNLLETISLYGGRFEEDVDMGGRRFNSNGWSLRTAGLFKVLRIMSPNLFGNNLISYALNHLDFRYSTGKATTDYPSSASNDQKFSTFNVIFYGLLRN